MASPLRYLCTGALILALGSVALAQSPKTGKRRLGPEINSEAREILPIISADGRTLYFVREDRGEVAAAAMNATATAALDDLSRQLGKLDPVTRKQMEDMLRQTRAQQSTPPDLGIMHQTIWFSERQPDGRWGAAGKLPPPLSDAVATIWLGSVLPDNNTLLVGGAVAGALADQWRKQTEGLGTSGDSMQIFAGLGKPAPSNDISAAGSESSLFAWSTRTSAGWTRPAPLRMRDFRNDSPRLEIFLAPDGRHTLFSIHNQESLGARDLYVSTLGHDGVWGKPANAGVVVNTPHVELSPFMAPDNRTLYFSSNRPGGRGGFDMYMTRRLDDTWQRWSPAENMGAEINTDADDMNLAVDASGTLAFMAIGPLMKEDIYEFELPAALRPRPVAFVHGTVTTPEGRPLPASLVYELLRDGYAAGQANARPGDGTYQIALPIGEEYAFRAVSSGYVAVSDRIDLAQAKHGERFERNLVLVPLEVGRAIRLNNVFFDTGKTALLSASVRELDRLVALLKDMPTLRIEVRGHTDALDDDAFNMTLSEGRAAAVVAYLAQGGVAASRLASRGFGETQPVAPNAREEGRQQNRRVEFVIISR